ncbi:MAG: ABC transporter permease [Ruminococcus sp.]|nr:ABC transporter permease [Ruminococcus sp.]
MKSIQRGKRLVAIMLAVFLIGMLVLIVRLLTNASYYITQSGNAYYGMIYDRSGEVLFDGINGYTNYEAGHFSDIGPLIGDMSGQMTNTLAAKNRDLLNNYSFTIGTDAEDGKASITTTLDHAANRAVFDAFGKKDGCAIAYNYKTGEILVCVSKPCIDIAQGYDSLSSLPSGSLLCKPFYRTVPGSTQKVSALAAAIETLGAEQLDGITYSCNGSFRNAQGDVIKCHHNGHGKQTVSEAFANSCNPYFAQLIQNDLSLEAITRSFSAMGYGVNGGTPAALSINGINCETATTVLTSTDEFSTQWGCIGQGDTLVSPCQLMLWQSAVANGTGAMTMPYLISESTTVTGRVKDESKTTYSASVFSADTAKKIREIMLENGTENYQNKIPGYTVGVKSGTAQVKNGTEENSLLVGFDSDPHNPIAFCILIENRKSGELTTDSIAKTLLDALKKEDKSE